MCGRYAFSSRAELISEQFSVACPNSHKDRFNIGPGQTAHIILPANAQSAPLAHVMQKAIWGVPMPGKTSETFAKLIINSRMETAAQKPMFKEAWEHHRCLVPASGFFEWKKLSHGKQPYYFHTKEPLFAFAGLLHRPKANNADFSLLRFVIMTTEADEFVREYHQRMPVILSPRDYSEWLAPDNYSPRISLFSSPQLQTYPVSTLVNSIQNDSPRCIAPIAEPPKTLSLF